MKAVNPYLNFPGNTEEAFNFYKSVFGGEFVGGVTRFRDFGEADGMPRLPEEDLDKVAHVALPLGKDNLLMGTDALESMGQAMGQSFTVGTNYYIVLDVDSAEEGERLFNALSAGGRVEMPLQKTEWAEQYGICADRFGVQWMFNYSGEHQA